MATLTINANDTENASSVQTRYRLLNSGNSYVVNNLDPADLPLVVEGLPNGTYEVGVRNMCNNGAFSPWVTGQSAPCPGVVSFTVVKSGSNFVINATLAGVQTKIQVQVTDPNGGITKVTNDFGSQSGTFNIAVPSGLFGNFSFVASGICDSTAIPQWQSPFSAPPVVVNVPAVPNAISIKLGGSTGAICGQSPTTVYSLATTIVPGVTVYYDSALTLEVNDMPFITNAGGLIFNLANTGLVGASTGINC